MSAAETVTLELWQTEWCPSSCRVRQRLTELGLPFLARQVPAEREARADLEAATGARSIPVLVADGKVVVGEDEILAHLDRVCPEAPEAAAHAQRAEKAFRKRLEEACPKLTADTH